MLVDRGKRELSPGKHVTKEKQVTRILKIGAATVSLVIIVGAVVFAALYAWKGYGKKDDGPQRTVAVTVSEGMNATQIGNLLEDKKVIKSAMVFRVIVKREGVGAEFKPGEYTLKTGMDYDEVIKALIEGPPVKYVRVTLPEGWTVKQMAERLAAQTSINKEEYLQIITEGRILVEYPFLKDNGAPTQNLEGYLYPDTYKVQTDMTAEEFVHMQLNEFQEKAGSANWENAEALGITKYEAVVIASMIERETRVDEERPIVAAVVYNRLKIGMPLQIDATVQYALPQWKDKLTLEDLKVDSPYNTYKHKGLPPGPICNPSASSVNAALSPTGDDYLYYVLAPDNSGRHVFTKSYNDFLNAKNRYNQSQR